MDEKGEVRCGVANGSTEFTRWEIDCFAALTMTVRNHFRPFTSVAPTALSADKGRGRRERGGEMADGTGGRAGPPGPPAQTVSTLFVAFVAVWSAYFAIAESQASIHHDMA